MGPCAPCWPRRRPPCPTGPEWLHEVKWDGMRVLADVHDGRLALTSRNGNDVDGQLPRAGRPGRHLRRPAARRRGRRPRRRPALLRRACRAHARAGPPQGRAPRRDKAGDVHGLRPAAAVRPDLTTQPLSARRELLERLDLSGPHWQVPPVYDDGEELFRATLEQGLEGVVSKRRSSALPRRAPLRRLAEVPAPHERLRRHRRLAAGEDQRRRPPRGGAAGRARRPRGWRYAGRMGSGIAGTAQRRAHRAARARCGPTSRPSATRSRASTPAARSGCDPEVVVEARVARGDARRAGCASRHTSGCAPT